MDATRFDRLTRSLIPGSSRRALLSGLAAALGATMLARTGPARAKKQRKRKLVFNAFGCVDVGGKCRGNSANCCSGICEGKKPKQGKRDKSRCVGHDGSTCQAGQQAVGCGGTMALPCTTSAGVAGQCRRTTGNAAYCVGAAVEATCRRDADCQDFFELSTAACIVCSGVPTGTLCAIPNQAG